MPERRDIPASLRPALEQYAGRLRERFADRLRAIVLFGSFARGTADEDSDIDLLVLVDALTPDEQWEASGDVAAVILDSGLALAPLILSSEQMQALRAAERQLARDIDRDGIPL
jgi:uncharacterized protein